MKRISLILMCLFAIIFLTVSCSPEINEKQTTTQIPQTIADVPKVTIDELLLLIESDADIVIVDVRDEDEFIEAHINGSISVPPPKIEAEEWEPPQGKTVVLY